MPSELTSEQVEKISLFLNGASAVADDSYLFALCARGLEEIVSKTPGYFDGLTRSAQFARELADRLRDLEARGLELDDLQAEVHALVECLAIVAKENTERGLTADMPVQQEIMRYFETCGMWDKGSGHLACIAYYNLG